MHAHTLGAAARTRLFVRMAFRDRYTPRARYRRIVLFYRRYYFSHLDIVYWYRPYISVRFHRPWPRIYYYYPERPTRRRDRHREGEKGEEERQGSREREIYLYISRDTLNGPPSRRAAPSTGGGILARESSILHGGIGSSLPIASRVVYCRGLYRVYEFVHARR